MRSRWGIAAVVVALAAGCSSPAEPGQVTAPSTSAMPSTSTPGSTPSAAGTTTASPVPTPARTGPDGRPFVIEEIAELDEPWAMAFLPDGRSLITGRAGELTLRGTDGQNVEVS